MCLRNKVVIDDLGNEHSYDKLFLSMGSQAFMPKNFPKMAGIFNMRSRLDADTLLPFLEPLPSTGTPAASLGQQGDSLRWVSEAAGVPAEATKSFLLIRSKSADGHFLLWLT